MPFFDSAAKLFSLGDQKKLRLCVSSISFTTTNYILTKLKTGDEAREILRRFKALVRVLPLDNKIIDLALNDSTFRDFEDAVQYFTALENRQEAIITRNLKDFKNSKIPAFTAEAFLSTMNRDMHS